MVILYSTGCPKCKILEKKLEKANIEYQTQTNIDEITRVCNILGVPSVPVLETDGNFLTFGDAAKWINERSDLN